MPALRACAGPRAKKVPAAPPPLQAVCDADRRFLYASMECGGATHDSFAWEAARTRGGVSMQAALDASEVVRRGCQRLAPWGFFLVADAAYRCCRTVATPWALAPIFGYADSFNFQQSRARINIECSFGMMLAKWLIFGRPIPWRVMDCKPHATLGPNWKLPLLLRVAMKLHNACIDDRLEPDAVLLSDFTGQREELEGLPPRPVSDTEAPRPRADLRMHLASGTRAPSHLSYRCEKTDESADTGWVTDDDVPATELSGPALTRQSEAERCCLARVKLTESLEARSLVRSNPRGYGDWMRKGKRG